MIDYRRWVGSSVMLVATLQAVAAIQPPLIAARSIASSGVAATNTATGATAAQLTVFGVPQKTESAAAIQAGRLDGSLADVAQRYPTVSSAHPIRDLHAINPAARFRLSAPLTTPEVLIDAIATGDPQALKTSLQNLGLRDVAVFSNDIGG